MPIRKYKPEQMVTLLRQAEVGLGKGINTPQASITTKGMRQQVRPEDFIGRLGSDEFIVVLPGLELETDALMVVRAFRELSRSLLKSRTAFVPVLRPASDSADFPLTAPAARL
jgi:hypothetical protein